MKKIAVILCGSGFKDGSEIRESVATLYALSKLGAEAHIFAPYENQFNVVNNLTGDELKHEYRNQLLESARIARGKVSDIKTLNPEEYQGLIIPGGFGAAKNLCTYAQSGIDGRVHPELKRILNGFYEAKKPIGAICIAPMILALNFKDKNFNMTLGKNGDTAEDLVSLGHKHLEIETSRVLFDKMNLILTTPAYMDDSAPLHKVFEGIEALVTEMINY